MINSSSEIFISLADPLIKFYEWKYFKVGTNFAYGIYMFQFAVFHCNVGRIRSASHFDWYNTGVSRVEALWKIDEELYVF
jgi:hypothetical protein